jgi:AGZA family xanthine/uracil permease-like MFS transporter
VSSNTTYIESAAGVRAGARTGLASLVTSGLFVLAIFISPLAQLVPSEAAAPVLVVVGGGMVWGFVVSAAQELRTRVNTQLELTTQTTPSGAVGLVDRLLARLEDDWEAIAAAAVLTILVMPFTYSITNGIGVGFITYVVAMLAARKAREVHPLMWVMAVAFVLYFALPLVQSWFGA